MSRPKGVLYINEYDIYKSKIIGNLNWIMDRYPNDQLLHEHINYMTNGMCSMVNLIIKDKRQLKRFKKEVNR